MKAFLARDFLLKLVQTVVLLQLQWPNMKDSGLGVHTCLSAPLILFSHASHASWDSC